jgi:hypothetical protein
MMPAKPTGWRVFAMAALAECVTPGGALAADCPELEQLQRAYFEAAQHIPPVNKDLRILAPWGRGMPVPPSKELCESYRRLSEAAKAWVEYARHHDELCRFSGLLPMMEREYGNAAEARDNVCSGRPLRPNLFPW